MSLSIGQMALAVITGQRQWIAMRSGSFKTPTQYPQGEDEQRRANQSMMRSGGRLSRPTERLRHRGHARPPATAPPAAGGTAGLSSRNEGTTTIPPPTPQKHGASTAQDSRFSKIMIKHRYATEKTRTRTESPFFGWEDFVTERQRGSL